MTTLKPLASGLAIAVVLANTISAQSRTMNAPASGPLAGSPDQFLRIGDMSIRYREVGHGDPVILVHGWARNSDDWAAVAESLSSTHRVIAMDVRGFGKSSKSGDSTQFGTKMSDDVIRLMDHLQLRRAHLAGQSMGALVVANAASRYPDRVASVTLIAGPFAHPRPPQEKMLIEDLRDGKGLDAFLRPLLANLDPAAAKAVSAQFLAQNDVPSLIASMSSFSSLDVMSGRPPRVPALVICGSADVLLAASRHMATWWSNAPLVEVAGASHIILGRPEVSTAMRSFIDGIRQ